MSLIVTHLCGTLSRIMNVAKDVLFVHEFNIFPFASSFR